jgi:hypothetical protein
MGASGKLEGWSRGLARKWRRQVHRWAVVRAGANYPIDELSTADKPTGVIYHRPSHQTLDNCCRLMNFARARSEVPAAKADGYGSAPEAYPTTEGYRCLGR